MSEGNEHIKMLVQGCRGGLDNPHHHKTTTELITNE